MLRMVWSVGMEKEEEGKKRRGVCTARITGTAEQPWIIVLRSHPMTGGVRVLSCITPSCFLDAKSIHMIRTHCLEVYRGFSQRQRRFDVHRLLSPSLTPTWTTATTRRGEAKLRATWSRWRQVYYRSPNAEIIDPYVSLLRCLKADRSTTLDRPKSPQSSVFP